MSHYTDPEFNVVLQLKKLRIRWVFKHRHDWKLATVHTLPWAMADREYRVCEDLAADVTVSVYGTNREDQQYLDSLQGVRFCISGESWVPPSQSRDVLLFGSGEHTGDNYRAAPTLVFWSPPTSCLKTMKCSAIETGMYPWRSAAVDRVATLVGGLDGYGRHFARRLPGAHSFPNEKYRGIRDHAFSIGIENVAIPDYITEKANDVLLNEAVLIYQGAPNWRDYFLPLSVLALEDIESVDWNGWRKEYDRRRPAVIAQKEMLRTRFNVFRYFIALAEKPQLLSEFRPITLATSI